MSDFNCPKNILKYDSLYLKDIYIWIYIYNRVGLKLLNQVQYKHIYNILILIK